MATYTYKGTKISGTSTTGKVFSKSGIAKATKNETYLNKELGHVYKCTEGGKASAAKWAYTKTVIVKKPDTAVTGLGAPVRTTIGANTYYMKASWKVPKSLTEKTNGDRAQQLNITWTLDMSTTSAAKDPKKVIEQKNESATDSQINLNSFEADKTYTRASFYPNTKVKLNGVSCKVVPYNKKGSGIPAANTRLFYPPRNPSLTAYTFNNSTGEASVTITTDAGTDAYERYDTYYIMTVKDTQQNNTWKEHNTNTTATSKTITYDVLNYQLLDRDKDYVQITTEAWARGYAGDSKHVSSTYYVSYPAEPTIDHVSVSSDDTQTGKCTIYINTNNTTEHPVDYVKLEYLPNSEYATASAIPGDAGWSTTDIVDDAECTAMSIGVTNLIPEPGKHTWVRVKSYHINESVLYRYSVPMEVTDLFTPAATATDDKITILSATANPDGESIAVQLGWNKSGADDSTGTELTWSESEDTWRSTDDPEEYLFTWSDGSITVDGVTYNDSALINIKGLNEGVKYYIKARRYLEGDTTTYSDYAGPETCITSQTPDAVVASCDRYVPNGSSLPIYWTFSGGSLQTAWQIVQSTWYELSTDTVAVIGRAYYIYSAGTYAETTDIYQATSDVSIVADKDYFTRTGTGTSQDPYVYTKVETPDVSEISTYYELKNPTTEGWYVLLGGAVIASDQNSFGSTRISSDRILAFENNGSLKFTVQVSTGSGWVVSEEHEVSVVDPPTLTLTVGATLTAQPFSFTATSNSECDLTYIVTSQGAVGQFPEGIRRQTSGDTIYNDVITPEWTYSNSAYSTTVTLPGGLDFWNGAMYTLEVTATDRTTGLQSETQSAVFTIAWTNPAVNPAAVTSYTATTDVTVGNKTYFEYNSVTLEYDPVDPVGTENPSTEGWYEASVTEFISLTPIDITDDEGYHRQAVQIDLTPPTGSQLSDLYDIYRKTGDGVYLIGRDFPLTYTTTDEYAPFGDAMTHHYRVAIRTVDGDVAFTDIEYVADGNAMRFDWTGGSLELPYNIQIGDKYKKDVEVRNHLDGSMDAYWNQNIERKDSLQSDVIRLESQEDIDAARQLARYPGAVFVRTPDGSAYEADVQVSDMSVNGPLESIAIDAIEIGLTQEFSLPVPYELEE